MSLNLRRLSGHSISRDCVVKRTHASRGQRQWLRPQGWLFGLPVCALATVHAEDDFTSWYTLEPRSYTFAEASVLTTGSANVSGGDDQLRWTQSKMRALSTVYHNDSSDLAVWGSIQRSDFSGDVTLPDGQEVPEAVTNVRAGATYRYFGDRWMIGSSVILQSSGENFLGGDDIGGQATVFGQYMFYEGWTTWGALQYEGLAEDAPVIAAGIRYQNDQLDVMLGYPWSQISWRPISEFQFKAIYYGNPWYTDVTWFLPAGWRVGVGAQQRHEAFFFDEQPDDDYQIQLRQIQLDGFVTYELPGYRYINFRLGQLVDRDLFADSSYEDDSENNREIDRSWVAELGVSLWW